MTDQSNIRKLKTFAKRYARAERIEQCKALDLVAERVGFGHWNALRAAEKGGWTPTTGEIAAAQRLVEEVHPYLRPAPSNDRCASSPERFSHGEEEGSLNGHAYKLLNDLDDVLVLGDGWTIRVYESPGKPPSCEVEDHKADGSPLLNDGFRAEAVALARSYAQKVRARISVDWDRRCTRPASDGTVRHPLGRGEADTWYCLHCNGRLAGRQLADNIWHCSGCGASPLDTFLEPFWLNEEDEVPNDVDASSNEEAVATPDVEIVEPRLKLELNQASIALLIRTALLEEATNTSERLGALCAEIVVDDSGDIMLVLDEDLWSEGKETVLANSVAAELGLDLEVACTAMTAPFAWPSLGRAAGNTGEYVSMLLAAYRQHGKVVR
ncbi:hypothetical protein [Palleronia sp.]|uniref:hypothetical protein n=1 Tax=Palleronia sp. TaxID=1940284 RepID=UPI0035C792CE